MQNTSWRYTYMDETKRTGGATWGRLCYLLRAARSRGEQVNETPYGYSIGTLLLTKTTDMLFNTEKEAEAAAHSIEDLKMEHMKAQPQGESFIVVYEADGAVVSIDDWEWADSM